jgi:hypothetical protein
MSEPRDDELSRVYRATRTAEPPGHVDDAILAASRRAVGSGPQRRSFVRRWAPSLALAASLVIAVALSLDIWEQRPDFEAIEAPPATRSESAPAAPADRFRAPREEPAAESPAKHEREAPRRDDAAARASADTAGAWGEQASLAKPAPAAATPPERAFEATATQPQKVQAAPAPASPAAAAGAAPAAAARSAMRDSAFSEAVRRSPQEWIEAIRKLKAQGRSEDVARELAAFRRAHPDFRVPDDLTQP